LRPARCQSRMELSFCVTLKGCRCVGPKTGQLLWQSHAGSPGELLQPRTVEERRVLGRTGRLGTPAPGKDSWATRGPRLRFRPARCSPAPASWRVPQGAFTAWISLRGRPLWKYQTSAPLASETHCRRKGTRVSRNGRRRVLALSLRSGKRLWELRTGVALISRPSATRLLPLRLNDAILLGLNRRSGHLAWRCDPAIPAAGYAADSRRCAHCSLLRLARQPHHADGRWTWSPCVALVTSSRPRRGPGRSVAAGRPAWSSPFVIERGCVGPREGGRSPRQGVRAPSVGSATSA